MRLLCATGDDDFSFVEYIDEIPPYAILSHTWGEDHEEVTYKDIYKGQGKGKTKLGYKKLMFCATQAAKDGIQYFWVDTCCIDKSSSAELSEAINSMYEWYHRSTVCYAYLSDVPCRIWNATREEVPIDTFITSRWFTRGWTFQELIAPKKVVFFAADGVELGDKETLVGVIAHHCHIPCKVIRSELTWDRERFEKIMEWTAHRQTKREEDAAYCLLGFFQVQMPLIYGEGKSKAFTRLQTEIARSRHQRSRRQRLEALEAMARFVVSIVQPTLTKLAPTCVGRLLRFITTRLEPCRPHVWMLPTFLLAAVLFFSIQGLIDEKGHTSAPAMYAVLAVAIMYLFRYFTLWTTSESLFHTMVLSCLFYSIVVISQTNFARKTFVDSIVQCSCSNVTKGI